MAIQVPEGHGPLSLAGGRLGAVVIHGFASTPAAMRRVAEALAGAGLSVEVPLLPGHATSPEDLQRQRFGDWLDAVDAAYADLAARTDRVIVFGQSMGGALGLHLIRRHPEIAAAAFVNPLIGNVDPDMVQLMRKLADSGDTRLPAVGDVTADPSVESHTYEWAPLEPLLSLLEMADELPGQLPEVRCPILLFTSVTDPVVDPWSSDVLAEKVGGPVERVALERSWHVATLDYDKELIEQRTVEFASRFA
jgi:carboxylesterase